MLVKAKKPHRKSKQGKPTRANANGSEPHELVEMTMAAIERKWSNQWVLIQVTRRKQYQTAAGLVLGHGPWRARKRLSRLQVIWHKGHPGVETFLFWTGDLIPKDVYPVL